MSNAADMKIKTAAGKPDLALIPLKALYGVARVFGYGAKKYERDNWKLAKDKEAPRRYVAAALRHLADMQDNPMALDEESGLPHLDHALCSLVMLRGLLNLHHDALVDPGEGKEPPAKDPHIGCETHGEAMLRLQLEQPNRRVRSSGIDW